MKLFISNLAILLLMASYAQAQDAEILPKPKEVRVIKPGYIMGVFIDSVIGERGQLPPVRTISEAPLKLSVGYPFVIADDGTITLPIVEPIELAGLTESEALAKVRNIYLEKQIIKKGEERIFISILQGAK